MRWLLVFAAGCYSPTPSAGAPCGAGMSCPTGLTCIDNFCLVPGTTTDGPSIDVDAPTDATVATPDACTTFASQLDTCTVAATGSLNLSGDHTYDTDTHELRKGNTVIASTHVQITGAAGPIDALVVDDFTQISGVLRVTGSAPFGIVAFGTITINGTIDAGEGGAGARERGACATAAGGVGISNNALGSSGGGGGALRGAGGDGGKGDANGTPINGAGGGVAIALPSGPIGGCPGGKGGGGIDLFGPPGDGGGAVYLVAKSTVTITGIITAGGAGAEHAHPNNGAGGGGGSGGMIVIEAPMVNVMGTLASNGGGGSGGADNDDATEGNDGEPGHASTTRAKGGAGAGTAEGGDGGEGGAGIAIDGAPSVEAADNGGGGGGGGCGFIAIGAPSKSTVGSTISPSLSTWPDPPH